MARRQTSRSPHRQIAESLVASVLNKKGGGKKGNHGLLGGVISIILVVLACLWTQFAPDSNSGIDSEESAVASTSVDGVPVREDLPGSEGVVVERCVDGDTLAVSSSEGSERVRLIGANTPETVKPNWPVEPFGPEASAYTKKRVAEAGNIAYLVDDGQRHDKYGRRLAIVYLGSDTVSLNEDLVRQGLAAANLQYTFSKEFKEKLSAAQEKAQTEGLGIHSVTE